MNNTKHFREFMQVIRRLNQPREVFISDGVDNCLMYAIPVIGCISATEKAYIDKVSKEMGTKMLDSKILDISHKIAPLNGGSPEKIATALSDYKKQGDNSFEDPLKDYRGLFLVNCKEEFDSFVDGVNSQILVRNDLAAIAKAMLSRIKPTEDFDPAKWKYEMALDPKIMPPSVLKQFGWFSQFEEGSLDISKYVNDKNEFTYRPSSTIEAPKQEESAEEMAKK